MTFWLILLGVWVVAIPACVLACAAFASRERRARGDRPAATVHRLPRSAEVPAARRRAHG